MKSTVWVIAAGDEDKDLVPSMLNDGVMLVGPSRSTGDLTGKDINKIPNLRSVDKSTLESIKSRIKMEQIIVLRLGSVCFAVGAIKSNYKFDPKYLNVTSYWNNGSFSPAEDQWSMQHTREVNWYVLNQPKAIHYFRKGIYGNPRRLYRLGGRGKPISKLAKSELDSYLIKLGYDGKNADHILKQIGQQTTGVNSFGFPN